MPRPCGETRQVVVEQHDVRTSLLGQLQAVQRVGRFQHHVFPFQQTPYKQARRVVVLDVEDARQRTRVEGGLGHERYAPPLAGSSARRFSMISRMTSAVMGDSSTMLLKASRG